MELTAKQRRILELIHRRQLKRGVSPTFHEIAVELGVSDPTVAQHIDSLERRGAIARARDTARSIRLTPAARLLLDTGHERTLVIAGRIRAGQLEEAVEEREETTFRELLGMRDGAAYFFLRVRGDSMIGAGICDGDTVVMERAEDAQPGDIVAVLDDGGQATLKKIYRHPGGGFRLQPANPKLKPIYVKQVRIQGVLRGLIRRFGEGSDEVRRA